MRVLIRTSQLPHDHAGQGRNFLADGDSIRITNCDFGPFEPIEVPILQIEGRGNIVDSCQFHDCQVSGTLLQMTSTCESPSAVQNCFFFDNYLSFNWNSASRWMVRAIASEQLPDCIGVKVFNNTFRDAQQDHGARAIAVHGRIEITANRITRTTGDHEFSTVTCFENGVFCGTI